MNKKYHFLSGLPRSGSTLLAGILSQNKNVHVSGTSGISGILVNIKNCWNDIAEFSALGSLCEIRKISTMRSVLDGFYSDIQEPIIIDKSRQWPGSFELLETILECKPKIIVTVRDVRDVLASFERLWREQKKNNLVIEQEKANPIDYLTIDGRCKVLMSKTGIVGSAAAVICDAVVRGWKRQMLFVDYDALCIDPKNVLESVGEFLDLEHHDYNFSNVSQSTFEDDSFYKWGELHKVRPVVAPQESQWQKYLPTHVAMQYSQDAKFWKSL